MRAALLLMAVALPVVAQPKKLINAQVEEATKKRGKGERPGKRS